MGQGTDVFDSLMGEEEEVVDEGLFVVGAMPAELVLVFPELVGNVDDDVLPQADSKIDAATRVIAATEVVRECRSVGLAFIDRSVGSSVRDAPSGTTN